MFIGIGIASFSGNDFTANFTHIVYIFSTINLQTKTFFNIHTSKMQTISDIFYKKYNRQLDLLENLTHKETPSQREIWKRKILELREDAQSIRRQGEHYDRMVSAGIRQRKEREELLARRRKNRDATTGGGEEDEMQQLSREADSLASSRNMMNDLLASGQANLSSLVGQRQRMRWVNRKMLDIGNKIGLSNSTMRMIERRDATDAYLVFGGMVVTMLVIYFLYF